LEAPILKDHLRDEGGQTRVRTQKRGNESSVPDSAIDIPGIIDRINTSDKRTLIEEHVLRIRRIFNVKTRSY
jgi:RecB family exonuclease